MTYCILSFDIIVLLFYSHSCLLVQWCLWHWWLHLSLTFMSTWLTPKSFMTLENTLSLRPQNTPANSFWYLCHWLILCCREVPTHFISSFLWERKLNCLGRGWLESLFFPDSLQLIRHILLFLSLISFIYLRQFYLLGDPCLTL